jgi:Nucleotidyl transferase of unknown function (DUF2204)
MFESLLERIALTLEQARIPYMIIGGQAVLLYGEPRLTKDIDVTLGIDLTRLSELVAVAKSIGLNPLADPEEFTRKTMVLPCSDPSTGIRVDFILSFSPYENTALGRARPIKIGNAEVVFVSLEDLVIHKILAGRPRDLEDVRHVLIRNPKADLVYIREWLREFSDSLGESFLATFDHLSRVLE